MKRHYFADKGPSIQNCGFSSSHVWMWELSHKEGWALMLWNCGVGEDSWESLGLQGDQTSQSWRQLTLNISWKDWCWSWSSNTDVKSWLIRKDPDAGKDWRQKEKGTTEAEMVGWHHWFSGYGSEEAPGDGEGQGSLICCSPCGSQRVRHDWAT